MKIAILSLLIALTLGIAGIYQFEEYQKFVTHTETSFSNIKTQINAHTSETLEFQKQLSELKQDGDWRITEVAHLLRLASLQLQISRDIPTTIQLLYAADNQLKIIQDPALAPVREAILKSRMALESVKFPDLEGLWFTVSAFISQIPELPTRGFRGETANASTLIIPTLANDSIAKTNETTDAEHRYDWRAGLHKTWQELKDIIKIQHHTKPIEPILPLSEQILAQAHLNLLLDQIRWAILHTNATVYTRSIQETNEWLDRHFEATDNRIKKMKESLSTLNEIELRPKLPDIGQALQLLQTTR
jgi:uroporphyrin-3 C-methyltransferase